MHNLRTSFFKSSSGGGGVAGMAGWTAISGYCPLYSLLGVSTCPLPQKG